MAKIANAAAALQALQNEFPDEKFTFHLDCTQVCGTKQVTAYVFDAQNEQYIVRADTGQAYTAEEFDELFPQNAYRDDLYTF